MAGAHPMTHGVHRKSPYAIATPIAGLAFGRPYYSPQGRDAADAGGGKRSGHDGAGPAIHGGLARRAALDRLVRDRDRVVGTLRPPVRRQQPVLRAALGDRGAGRRAVGDRESCRPISGSASSSSPAGTRSSVVVGILLGIVLAESTVVRGLVDPWISMLYATPIIALGPLFILWLGIGVGSKIAIVFLTAVFPILINTVTGLTNTDRNLIEVARSFGATRQPDLHQGAAAGRDPVHHRRAAPLGRPGAGRRRGGGAVRRARRPRLPHPQCRAGVRHGRPVRRRASCWRWPAWCRSSC